MQGEYLVHILVILLAPDSLKDIMIMPLRVLVVAMETFVVSTLVGMAILKILFVRKYITG